MLKKIFSSTILEILRSPVTKIGVVLAFIYCLICRFEYRKGEYINGILELKLDYLLTIMGCIINVLVISSIILLTVFIVSIMRDTENSFYDIELSTKMKPHTYLFAKAAAYMAVYLSFLIFFTAENFFSFYIFGLVNIDMPFVETFLRFFAYFLYFIIPFGLYFVSMIMAVTLISKRKILAIVFFILYILINSIFEGTFLCITNNRILHFLVKNQNKGTLDLLWTPTHGALVQTLFYSLFGAVILGLLVGLYPKIKKNLFD